MAVDEDKRLFKAREMRLSAILEVMLTYKEPILGNWRFG
jgi:hypothetical protein